MKIKIASPNLNSVVGGLHALITGIPIASNQSAKIIANQVLELSQNGVPCVPVDTEDLKKTGRVETVSEGYAVVYGGGGGLKWVDYAGYVHDDLRARKYKRPGSGPKFVETHMLRMADAGKPIISIQLDKLAHEILFTGRGGVKW